MLKYRLQHRFICNKCLITFLNIENCLKCNSILKKRSDDNLDIFKIRYEFFLKEVSLIKKIIKNNKISIKILDNNTNNLEDLKFKLL